MSSRRAAQLTGLGAVALAAVLAGCRASPSETPADGYTEYTYTNGYSGVEKVGEEFSPFPPGDTTPRPLLVYAHWYGGTREAARSLGYYEECARRGWYVVCPFMHHREFVQHPGFCGLEAQHDIERLYRVFEYIKEL